MEFEIGDKVRVKWIVNKDTIFEIVGVHKDNMYDLQQVFPWPGAPMLPLTKGVDIDLIYFKYSNLTFWGNI